MKTKSIMAKNLIFALVLLAVFFLAISGNQLAFAEETTHSCEDHTSETPLYLAGDGSGISLSDGGEDAVLIGGGSYYLTCDIVVESSIEVPAGDAISLCLNGFDIKYQGSEKISIITVLEGATLNLYDSTTSRVRYGYWDNGTYVISENQPESGTAFDDYITVITGGVITGGTGSEKDIFADGSIYEVGGGILNSGTLNLFGGAIAGNVQSRGGIYNLTASSTTTINGGYVVGNTAITNGGGISVLAGTLNINGGVIADNIAVYGGGVFGGADTEIFMTDGLIQHNIVSVSGGGIYSNSSVNISGGEISQNTAGEFGGGIYVSGEITIDGGNILNNICTGNGGGGGIAIFGDLTMNDGVISGNIAHYGGGIADVRGSSKIGEIYIYGGEITDNIAVNNYDSTSGVGGGLCVQGSCYIFDVLISGNFAESSGGAIYSSQIQNTAYYTAGCILGHVEITGGEISNNYSAVGGGVVVNDDGDGLKISDSVIMCDNASGDVEVTLNDDYSVDWVLYNKVYNDEITLLLGTITHTLDIESLATRIDEDITLVNSSVWLIEFSTDGGTSVNPLLVQDGSVINRDAVYSEKSDYILEGWYKDSGLTEKWDFADAVQNSMTLYAKWDTLENIKTALKEEAAENYDETIYETYINTAVDNAQSAAEIDNIRDIFEGGEVIQFVENSASSESGIIVVVDSDGVLDSAFVNNDITITDKATLGKNLEEYNVYYEYAHTIKVGDSENVIDSSVKIYFYIGDDYDSSQEYWIAHVDDGEIDLIEATYDSELQAVWGICNEFSSFVIVSQDVVEIESSSASSGIKISTEYTVGGSVEEQDSQLQVEEEIQTAEPTIEPIATPAPTQSADLSQTSDVQEKESDFLWLIWVALLIVVAVSYVVYKKKKQ